MVGTSMITATTFPRFMSLAIELRSQIWRDALPDNIEPALYQFKRGCWHPVFLSESDYQYRSWDEVENLRLQFFEEMLGNVQIKTPLVSVNYEAREIAVNWAHEMGFFVQEIGGYPIFSCPFDPEHDMLYIPPGQEISAKTEPVDILTEFELTDTPPCYRIDVENFAVAESTILKHNLPVLGNMFSYSPMQTLTIIIGSPPKIRSAGNDSKLQERWELRQEGEYDWSNTKEPLEFQGRKFPGKENLYRILGELNECFYQDIEIFDIPNFKVKVVSAIRK
ncbi:hypothetical protein BOTCAL_0180g00230 [Botryotinia calthae]|uniref:2EXR domain-containing protein n=1 Tax=Botryotinia calthae TaxID=38488 RepID=A0A4Y8D311_9HELO|nr:hypothetical protein BOTCAL_0180g00230 [Botryotinia calthae]